MIRKNIIVVYKVYHKNGLVDTKNIYCNNYREANEYMEIYKDMKNVSVRIRVA